MLRILQLWRQILSAGSKVRRLLLELEYLKKVTQNNILIFFSNLYASEGWMRFLDYASGTTDAPLEMTPLGKFSDLYLKTRRHLDRNPPAGG